MHYFLKQILCVVLLSSCFVWQASTVMAQDFSKAVRKDIDLDKMFHGRNGCAVLYTPSDNVLEIYNENMVAVQAAPQSTFKIVATLMGLENGIIQNTNSKMHYNGTKYWLEAWNKDVTLAEAFQYSCVWYFHQVVYAIAHKNVRDFLQKIHYGNEDLSQWQGNGSNKLKELNGFWLSSSLKISPLQQVEMLWKIFSGKTHVKHDYINILQNIMFQENHNQDVNVYAKTGSNVRGKSWFVGFVDKHNKRTYFAFYVDDKEGGVSGAKEVALEWLLHLQTFK